jgi:hypothetical protein
MPRARLSRSERAEDRRCLREMHHEGIDVGIPDDWSDCVPALYISVIGGLDTLIFNLPSGLAGYAIVLRLVAGKAGLILLDCQITTESDEQIVLESFDLRGPVCRLGQCEYQKSDLLNDRFPLKFNHRGSMVEAVILATGLKPIPEHVMTVRFQLTFWDQFGNGISVESELSVDRSTTPRPRLLRPQSSLHDSGEILGMHEPFGREEPGLPEAPMPCPWRKPENTDEVNWIRANKS